MDTHPDGQTQHGLIEWVRRHRTVWVSLGCVLLFLGCVFPVVCYSGGLSSHCISFIRIYDAFSRNVLIAVMVLIPLLIFAVNQLKSPASKIIWASIWIFAFIFCVLRIRWLPDSQVYFPLIDIPLDIPLGIRFPYIRISGDLLHPISEILAILPYMAYTACVFLAFWLVIRPSEIYMRFRDLTIFVLAISGELTLLYFISAILETIHLTDFDTGKARLGAALSVIMVGVAILLIGELLERRNQLPDKSA
ncbi:MAG TPA: hypothetical protein VMT46_05980 [Anaerolineaceae bacterium]|nr:hypothetical protein [Anaerolineaceae bacterium]